MDKKILFFDIDGTLIDEKTDMVPESAIQALKIVHEQGHYLFLCSGRCRAIIPQSIIDIGFDGMVGGCGTYIEIKDEVVFHHKLQPELQKQMIEDLKKYHIDGVLEGYDCSAFRKDYWMSEVCRIFTENGSFKSKTQCFWEDEISFDKMALWHDETSDMKAFREKYRDRFEFIERDPTFFEVVPLGISKATGMDFVCQKLGIDKKNSIAFGDSANDVSMLANAGYSVAMGGGNPILFDKVDFVTKPVMEDGIAHALSHLNLI